MTRHPASLFAIAAICTGIVMITTLGEFIPGLLASVFKDELNTPGAAIGALVATIFFASFVCSIPAGWISDRVAPRTMLLAQVLCAAGAFAAFAFADSTLHLFIACALVGVVMAFNPPSTNRIIVNYLRPAQQPAAVGWRTVGVQASMVFGSLIFAASASWVSWRITILLLALAMAACGAWMYAVLRRRTPIATRTVADTGTTDAAHPDCDRTGAIAWWMIPYTLFTSGAVSAMGTYFVIFGTDHLGLTLSTASLASGMYAAVSLAARVYWVRMLRNGGQVRLLVIASTLTAVAFVILATTPILGTWSFWLATLLVGATSAGTGPLAQIVTVMNANPRRVGTVTGWVSLGTFGGLMLQPLLLAALIGPLGIAGGWIAVAMTSLLGSATIGLFAIVSRKR